MTDSNHSYSNLSERLVFVYALLIGVAGVLTLVWLIQYQTMSFDLAALLPFAVLSIMVSYFRIPIPTETELSSAGALECARKKKRPRRIDLIGPNSAELSVDGAILLGAMLTGGPVIGGWAAFITGLVVSIHPQSKRPSQGLDWTEQVALAALNGGRNVIAIGAAWLTFFGLGGKLDPLSITPEVALALLLMCMVYALIRLFLVWLLTLFVSSQPLQSFFQAVNARQFLIELLPLPIALTFSPIFVRFTWTRFLTLALIFIGSGAVMRSLAEQARTAQEQIETLRLRRRVERAFNSLPSSVATLCNLAHQFCQEIVQAQCEIGFFNETATQVHVQISSGEKESLPSMQIPMTAFWSWIGSLDQVRIVQTQADLDSLPFPPLKLAGSSSPQSAVLIPIPDRAELDIKQEAHGIDAVAEREPAAPAPVIGGIVLLSEPPHFFDAVSIERLTMVAALAGAALHRMRANPFDAIELNQAQIASHIQQSLRPARTPVLPGWQVGAAGAISPLSNGAWFDWFQQGDTWTFCISEPLTQKLRGALLSTVIKSMIHTLAPHKRGDPFLALQELNTHLCEFSRQAALLYLVYEHDNLLTWGNAGCPAPLWWHSTQDRVAVMELAAPALGAGTEFHVETTSIALAPGDAFVLYSRGIIEASYEGESWQARRLSEAIRQFAQLPADALAQALLAQMQAFVHYAPLEQDAFVIVLKPGDT